MNEETAQALLNARSALAGLWRRETPEFVRLTAMIVDHALLKCLQMGEWDVYIDPEDGAMKLLKVLRARPSNPR